MEAQNGAHACDCGKVKVTLLNKRNAAEALTAPLNGKAIAIDDVADLIYIVQTDKSGCTTPFCEKSITKLLKGNGRFYRPFSFLLFSKNFSKKC